MASLSQALRLGDLPPPHRTFQGHATHIIEWSMMLRPNDSWSTCILQGIATFLHYASRRSAGYRYTTVECVLRGDDVERAANDLALGPQPAPLGKRFLTSLCGQWWPEPSGPLSLCALADEC